MVGKGSKPERPVFKRICEPLEWPEKIRRRRVDEQKMLEPFRNKSPAANKGITQNEGRVVPNKLRAQCGQVRGHSEGNERA